MTDEEKFIFDLDGYLVVKDALTEDETAALNEAAAKHVVYGDGATNAGGRCLDLGAPAIALMDHPRILPYLIELLGPRFRLDHDYCLFMKQGSERGGLHGGEWGGSEMGEMDHWYRYRDGAMRNGLTVVTYALRPAGSGDGGFACIPGSHKSHFLGAIPGDVRSFARRPHYVRQPALDAGDALIFTEALVHGTIPWAAEHERRALLYKYSPGHSAWATGIYDDFDMSLLTDQQSRLLLPPSVGRRPDVVQNGPAS